MKKKYNNIEYNNTENNTKYSNRKYKNLFDNYFSNVCLDLCNYPINILNYLCIHGCSK